MSIWEIIGWMAAGAVAFIAICWLYYMAWVFTGGFGKGWGR